MSPIKLCCSVNPKWNCSDCHRKMCTDCYDKIYYFRKKDGYIVDLWGYGRDNTHLWDDYDNCGDCHYKTLDDRGKEDYDQDWSKEARDDKKKRQKR